MRAWGAARLRIAAGVTFAVGLAATAASEMVRGEREDVARREDIARRGAELSRLVAERFGGPVAMMHAVASLISATGGARNAAFSHFARDAIRREPLIYALEWAPRVTRDERAAFEAEARADGMDGYEIREDGDNGELARAGERDVYFPLRYLVPMNDARGFDLRGSGSAAERACRSGAPVASERYHLVEDPPAQWAVYAIEPVWTRGDVPADPAERCATVSGFVVLLFRLDPVMREIVRHTELGDLELAVRDVTGGGQVLVENLPGAADRAAAHDDLGSHERVGFVDRTWEVVIAPRDRPSGSWWLLALGVLASASAAALVYGALAWRRLRLRLAHALRLGQYHLEQEIGRGGMGVVYRARHDLLRRPTALKLLAAPPGDETALLRFEREVHLTAELTHPNTIAIYDYGRTPDGRFYYVMEYLDGVTLQDVLEHDGEQPIARTIFIVKQIASALREAHGIGLVHRDLKPGNLMISVRGGLADFVKVLDFGLVKRIGLAEEIDGDADGMIMGTPGYTAPEALRGETVDQRADLYSIGVVWYALLARRAPFAGATEAEIVAAQICGQPTPIERLRVGLPAGLAGLVMRCLADDPAERVASAEQLLEAIEALDVPAWSEGDAHAWWATRAPAIMASRRAITDAHGAAPATVSIDPTRGRAPSSSSRRRSRNRSAPRRSASAARPRRSARSAPGRWSR